MNLPESPLKRPDIHRERRDLVYQRYRSRFLAGMDHVEIARAGFTNLRLQVVGALRGVEHRRFAARRALRARERPLRRAEAAHQEERSAVSFRTEAAALGRLAALGTEVGVDAGGFWTIAAKQDAGEKAGWSITLVALQIARHRVADLALGNSRGEVAENRRTLRGDECAKLRPIPLKVDDSGEELERLACLGKSLRERVGPRLRRCQRRCCVSRYHFGWWDAAQPGLTHPWIIPRTAPGTAAVPM